MGLTFTGTQCVYIPFGPVDTNSTFLTQFPCSLACWFKPSSFPTATFPYEHLMGTGNTATFTNEWVRMLAAGNLLEADVGAQGNFYSIAGSTMSTSTWYHCAAVFPNQTTIVIYLNGVAVSTPANNTTAGGFPLGQNVFSIGAVFNSFTTPAANSFVTGELAYAATWNGVALSSGEVTTLYNAGSGSDPRNIEPANLVSFMMMTSATPFLDNITGVTWSTTAAVPAFASDPFSISVVSTPVMTVMGATNVTATTATLTGTIVFTRGAAPTIEGFNYGTTTGYGSNVNATGSFTTGPFSLNVTGLTPSTIYHFQSYATNSQGTGTSADVYFTTPQVGLPPGTPTPFNSRTGFSCSFDQQGASPNWVPATVIPFIAASGVGWIRDTVNWSLFELTQGNYALYTPKSSWMQLIHTYGLKFCGLVQYPPLFYGNTSIGFNEVWPMQATANFCAWLATSGLVDAIELINEANNISQFHGPANGGSNADMQVQVTLTNLVRAAVNAVAPSIPVIGLDQQGSEVIYMLSQNPVIDGVVYHAYDLANNIPETCYEPPYVNYVNWVQTVRSISTLPIWETEFNGDPNFGSLPQDNIWGEYSVAVWLSRRLLLSWWLNINYLFIYTFTEGDIECVMDYYYGYRQEYFTLQRLLVAIGSLGTTGQTVTLTNLSAGFDTTDVTSVVLCSSTSTVAAVWLGNNSPNYPPAYGTANVSFPLANTHVTDSIVDTVSGAYSTASQYSASVTSNVMTLVNLPITDIPQLITISGAFVAQAPFVSAMLVTNITTTSATLNGTINYDGGSSSTVTGFNYGPTGAFGTNVHVTQSIDTGNFTNAITGLTQNTTYYFQAYATNGTGAGFSPVTTFTTQMVASIPSSGPSTDEGGGYYDHLIHTIVREKKSQAVPYYEGQPTPQPLEYNGALPSNQPPPEFQNEYQKLYLLSDAKYRL